MEVRSNDLSDVVSLKRNYLTEKGEGLLPYLQITRPDHWFKNIFMLPGAAFAIYFLGGIPSGALPALLLAFCAACLIASANYVINEWLDAAFDRNHPVKKFRPAATGKMRAQWIYIEYAVLAAAGLAMARSIGSAFFLCALWLLAMGLLYNVHPARTKERIYLDVLSESVNNPIRLLMGWFAVTDGMLPPSSLILGYWMAGAFLMAMKRFSELRFIANRAVAGSYRRSFLFYTENNLLVSAFFYAMCSAFCLGVFLIKYRLELVLCIPGLAGLFAWYLYIALKPNSAAQNPEALFREPKFLVFVLSIAALMVVLLAVDIPVLHRLGSREFINARLF